MMIVTYLAYVALSLIITFWVGRTLNKNGRIFLIENFSGKAELADSVNHLLLIGFYLVNIGFMTLALKFGSKPTSNVEAIEFLSTKIGLNIVIIGMMHFFLMSKLVQFKNSKIFKSLDKSTSVSNTVTANG